MGRILSLHENLIKKKLSAFELAQMYLSAVKRDNGALGAYVRITEEEALKTAKAVDEKIARGENIGLLAGIPMTLKDNISTKGIETTCCSNILRGYMPIYNATAWEKLQALDAVLLGKTNMDEFAMGSSCERSCFFPSRNPYNTDYVPGGSSGGSASAVSGNLAVYALGSDTGGSVRQPSALCGIVGLKPTYGAISRSGLIAFASGLDQIGIMAGNVEDTAIVFDAVCGKDPMDSTSRECEGKTFKSLNSDLKGKKIGVAKEFLEGLSQDVEKAFFESLNIFKSLGAQVIYFDMPYLKYTLPVYHILACAEASSNLGRYDGIRYGERPELYESIHEMVSKCRSEGFGDEVKRRILMGTYVLSKGYYDAYYKKAQTLRRAVIEEFSRAFEKFHIIATPTSPTTAWKIGESSGDPVENYQADICTVPVNIASLPAVSVPCGVSEKGLPIGLQLIGNSFGEKEILSFAYEYEKARSFFASSDWGVKL